jgi:hypothetical protein
MNESWRLVLNSRFHDLHKVINDSWVKVTASQRADMLYYFSPAGAAPVQAQKSS